jgi:hypothetical protein
MRGMICSATSFDAFTSIQRFSFVRSSTMSRTSSLENPQHGLDEQRDPDQPERLCCRQPVLGKGLLCCTGNGIDSTCLSMRITRPTDIVRYPKHAGSTWSTSPRRESGPDAEVGTKRGPRSLRIGRASSLSFAVASGIPRRLTRVRPSWRYFGRDMKQAGAKVRDGMRRGFGPINATCKTLKSLLTVSRLFPLFRILRILRGVTTLEEKEYRHGPLPDR